MGAEGGMRDRSWQAALLACALLVGCGKTAPVVTATPPPAPAATPVAVADPLPSTIDEARSLLRNGQKDAYERGLQALSQSVDSERHRRALALLGLYYFDEKRWDDAFKYLSQAANANPAIASYLRLRLIDVEVARGNVANAATIALQIMSGDPDSSAATLARLRLPALVAQTASVELPTVDAAFADAARVPVDAFSADGFASLAADLEKAGRQDLALIIRMRLLTEYRGGRYAEAAYRSVATATPSPLDELTFDQTLTLATDLAAADRYDQALDLFDRIAKRFPFESKADAYKSARFRALFNSRHYDQLLKESAAEKLTAPVILLRARAAWRQNKRDVFLKGLDEIDKKWPKSPEAVQVKLLRAKYYVTDETDYDKSVANLSGAINAGAFGNEGENLWTLAFTYILAGRDAEALTTLDQYIAKYPDSDYTMNALFWSGKVLDRLGRRQEADAKFSALIAQYPFNYFAYRARELRPELALTPSTTTLNFPDLDAQLASVNDPRLAAVDELEAIGLTRDASREMKRIAAAYPDNFGVTFKLADIYVHGGEPAAANGILQRRFRDYIRHGGQNVPMRFWQILYPLNYWEAIRTEAAKQNVDPYLIASIIRQESGFEPTVVSNAGAVGLMQIMPYEADRIAGWAGISDITREKLFNPVTNITVGAAEYAHKVVSTGNNPILAIAAYNAGEDAVGRWIAHTPIDDVDLFVESIPYAETRLYVKSVMRNRFEYRRIYEGSISSTASQASK